MPFVTRKDFWLFSPSSNAPWWYLINENDWAEVARPGMRLGMSLFQADHIWLPRGANSCCYVPHHNLAKMRWPLVCGPEEDSYIRFSRPVPSWSSLPANLEFRWWYVRDNLKYGRASNVNAGLSLPPLARFRWHSPQAMSDVEM